LDGELDNRLILVGEIVSLEPTRFSPAGIPIAKAVIRHESWQAGQKMQCELAIAAQGENAARLSRVETGRRVRVVGPLSRANQNSRNLLMWIEHLTEE
jgi:primosomal replication protein N